MKRFPLSLALLAALPLAALPGLTLAQGFGAEFMTNWDLDEDGQVTLAEVQERRGDLFYMFDANEDGMLNDDEYAMFDETRAADREMHLEAYGSVPGQGQAMGQGQGQGKGMGMGQGQGQGQMAVGIDAVQDAMTRRYNDMNGDGVVTRDEFVGNGAQWFARMDRSGDAVVTLADFDQ